FAVLFLFISGSIVFFFFFFFSSRRRHTRSDRDWSSDVCSSDLRRHRRTTPSAAKMPALGVVRRCRRQPMSLMPCAIYHHPVKRRSEERRVGKECRARRARDQEKKKMKRALAGGKDNQKRSGA